MDEVEIKITKVRILFLAENTSNMEIEMKVGPERVQK